MTPDAAGIEAALAAGLAAHVALGDEDDGIEQCSCGAIAVWRRDEVDEDSVRYLATHAEGPDLRWHRAHVAAALLPMVTQAQAAERERVAKAIEAEAARMHAAFAAEEDELLERMRQTHGPDWQPQHWNRHDDGCAMCGTATAVRIARADESGTR